MQEYKTCPISFEPSVAVNWAEVFYCLQFYPNSTNQLGVLRVERNDTDFWLDEQQMNFLVSILSTFLLFNRVFCWALMWYMLLFVLKCLHYHGMKKLEAMKRSRKERADGITSVGCILEGVTVSKLID